MTDLELKKITLTPEMAMQLLDRNGLNRPLSDMHVSRIARQIKAGKWKFNGDTIKIADTNDVLDGQHRLWAVIEAREPVETILITGIKRDAFATIDTLRRPRSGSDVLTLNGAHQYRAVIASAIPWLVRWQRGTLLDYRNPKNRVENSDIEDCYRHHGGITQAAERAVRLKAICAPGLLAFFYYILVNRNPSLAERMMRTLEYPNAVGITDPYFCLRAQLIAARGGHTNTLVIFAWMIKASNAAYRNKSLSTLSWRNQGDRPEKFPELTVEGAA
jgi:hypothetical protein